MGNEHQWFCDDLSAGGVMFTDPGFVVSKAVKKLDDLDITLQRDGGVLGRRRIEWRHENAEAEPLGHLLILRCRCRCDVCWPAYEENLYRPRLSPSSGHQCSMRSSI